jgi:hypothetical protein
VKIYLHSDHPLRRICNNFTASYWMILLDLEGKRKTNLENVGSVDVRSQVLVPLLIGLWRTSVDASATYSRSSAMKRWPRGWRSWCKTSANTSAEFSRHTCTTASDISANGPDGRARRPALIGAT